ncbi:MAG: hypothetical protein ABSF70_05245 [Terracidiphilus sp.]|jgi:hypothetical protein
MTTTFAVAEIKLMMLFPCGSHVFVSERGPRQSALAFWLLDTSDKEQL